MRNALSYDDVLLMPAYSDIKSRSEVTIETDLGNGLVLDMPILASPMDTISESSMAISMSEYGGAAIIHRYNTVQEQVKMVGLAHGISRVSNIGAAVGISRDTNKRTQKLVDAGAEPSTLIQP